MKYIGAIDQGTTSTRFIIFDQSGHLVSSAQREHKQIFPQAGWVEHDPLEILENTRLCMAEALIKAKLHAQDIAAIGISNQRETTVVWNKKTGKPYANALVWQDMRSQTLVEKFAADFGSTGWAHKTGLPFSPYFSAMKLKWLVENVPALRADAEKGDALFGTIDTWLIWNASGEHKTDVTNASRTMLMNLHTLTWDQDILKALDIPLHMLPTICPNVGFICTIKDGIFKGISIMACLGDQHAALIGQTCFEPGQAKNTYGTGCFLLMNTGEKIVPSNNGLLTTIAYQFEGQPCNYALEGSIAVTGSLMQWLRDNLGIIQASEEVEKLAASVPDNGDVYLVPAFSGLYAPYWRSDARGIIVGLTRYANKAHIARAALEATAYQTLDVLQAMEADSGINLQSLNVDGGMVVNELLMQFQADMLQVPLQRPLINETTALGAAYAAGLACGIWKTVQELKQHHHIHQTWQPYMEPTERDRLYKKWIKAVERSMNWTSS